MNQVIQEPKNASTLVLSFLDKNFMQIGGFTPAKAKIDWGNVQIPSPQISPEATAGAKASAFLLFIFLHTNRIRLPKHMSMAK